MSKKLKAGDKVKVYGSIHSVDGGSHIMCDGGKGIIVIKVGKWLTIDMPNTKFGYKETATIDGIHIKQVRKV